MMPIDGPYSSIVQPQIVLLAEPLKPDGSESSEV
jgi:hypothetical protein